ncbi:MAG: ORF6N domain-containing protein [Terriglobia bacterium]
MSDALVLPVEVIERQIYLVRGHKVMLDTHLAKLYGVKTFNLNKAVKRNLDRFPEDFMFQLTREEAASLKFQIGMSKPAGRGGRRTLPYVFTEQGVAMLSSVLNSKRAVQVNIVIMRAFVKLRELLSTHKEVLQKLDDLERKYQRHDAQIGVVFDAIRKLIETPAQPKSHIGFTVPARRSSKQA